MKTEFKRNSGLTTTELLVATAIMAVIIIVAAGVLIGNVNLFTRGSSLIDITNNNKIALDEIVNEIRQSESVVNSCTPCGADMSNPSTLILRQWPLDNDGNPINNGNFDFIIYKRDPSDNSKIRKIVYPDPTSDRSSSNKIIGSNTSSLTFTYNNSDPSLSTNVLVKIKNNTTSNGVNQEIEREAKAVLRNK